MPFSIFRLRTLRGANIVGLLVGMSLFSMFFFISLYLQNVLHFSPIQAGLSYLPLAMAIIISAGAASNLVTRVGFKPTLIAGLLFVAAGLTWFSRVSPHGSYAADVLGASLLAAVGLGLSFVSVTIAAVTGISPARGRPRVGPDQHRSTGWRRARASDPRDRRQQPHEGVAPGRHARPQRRAHEGVRSRVLVGAGFALAGALLAAVLISSRDSRDHATEARAEVAAAAASATSAIAQ